MIEQKKHSKSSIGNNFRIDFKFTRYFDEYISLKSKIKIKFSIENMIRQSKQIFLVFPNNMIILNPTLNGRQSEGLHC
jgi:hypothetical protein